MVAIYREDFQLEKESMMPENKFQQQIAAYDHWKNELLDAIEQFNLWMIKNDLDQDSETSLRIYESVESLKNDRLNLAFVAEFSRGKTELINAIFFSDYKCRLLPSDSGRTTMCPTELFYDHEAECPYLRLLPIESRLDDMTLQQYKEDPIQWTQIPLPVDSPEDMQNILQEIIQTREVTIKKAAQLGLYDPDLYPHLVNSDPETTVIDIPAWRHALISFPHPLLKQGLSILDTPGLNALGSEPELTMNMLPAAQAILFILAADTGVTHSDLTIWQQHVSKIRKVRNKGIAVVLNKIDTLWDELKSKHQIEQSINKQINKTSQLLGVSHDNIFPVSAQKGLLAKINEDEVLLQRSQLGQLERFFSEKVLPEREDILKQNIADELGSLVTEHQDTFILRLNTVNKQLNDLHQLNGKNSNIIAQLIKRTKAEKEQYSKHIEGFQSSNRLLNHQVSKIKHTLSLKQIDAMIQQTRQSMTGSWTTSGLKKSMQDLFEKIHEMSELATTEVDSLQRLVIAVYKKFHDDHGIKANPTGVTRIRQQLETLKVLYQEAEQYRKSPVTTMTEQNFVVKRFFIEIVSKTRNTLFEINTRLDTWIKEAMRPLSVQIRENKESIEKRLNTLRKVSDCKGDVEARTKELEGEHARVKQQLDELESIRQKLIPGA